VVAASTSGGSCLRACQWQSSMKTLQNDTAEGDQEDGLRTYESTFPLFNVVVVAAFSKYLVYFSLFS